MNPLSTSTSPKKDFRSNKRISYLAVLVIIMFAGIIWVLIKQDSPQTEKSRALLRKKEKPSQSFSMASDVVAPPQNSNSLSQQKEIDTSDHLRQITRNKDGSISQIIRFSESGNEILRVDYKDDQEHRTESIYTDSGKLVSRKKFLNGRLIDNMEFR